MSYSAFLRALEAIERQSSLDELSTPRYALVRVGLMQPPAVDKKALLDAFYHYTDAIERYLQQLITHGEATRALLKMSEQDLDNIYEIVSREMVDIAVEKAQLVNTLFFNHASAFSDLGALRSPPAGTSSPRSGLIWVETEEGL